MKLETDISIYNGRFEYTLNIVEFSNILIKYTYSIMWKHKWSIWWFLHNEKYFTYLQVILKYELIFIYLIIMIWLFCRAIKHSNMWFEISAKIVRNQNMLARNGEVEPINHPNLTFQPTYLCFMYSNKVIWRSLHSRQNSFHKSVLQIVLEMPSVFTAYGYLTVLPTVVTDVKNPTIQLSLSSQIFMTETLSGKKIQTVDGTLYTHI